jgi:hypothetical protein
MKKWKGAFKVVAIIIISINIPLSAEQKPQWKGTMTKEGDVMVIKNPKEPIYKEPILSLKEDFMIGGAPAKGEYALALPRSLAVDKDGNLFILDSKESCIKVFDNSGKYVRSIGRRGQGPGEIGGASSMSIPLGSNELIVVDISNSRLAFFSTDGRFIKNVRLRGTISGVTLDSHRNVYLSFTEFSPGELRDILRKLRKMNPDMSNVLAEIVSHSMDESRNPFKPWESWIVDDKDRLIYGDAKTYEIRYFGPDGKQVRRIIREYDLLKVSQEDIDEFRNRPTPPGLSMARNFDFSSHHAAYRSFFVDDLGNLFIQTWERTADNRQDIHDIFDAEGRFLGRVPLNRHSDLINPRVRFIRSGKLYTIEPDDEGYEVVKRYSVTWLLK